MMRCLIALVVTMTLGAALSAQAQTTSQTPAGPGEALDDDVVVIDTPPAPAPPPPVPRAVPSDGVVLQRPGQVLLYGTPVRVDFRSPTDGVGFQLQAGGSYSQISGVSYGVGFGGGFGYGAWGYGGYGFGVAPYYGDIVTRAYQPICEAPCQATLLSGRHRMALSLRGGAPVNVGQPVNLTEDAIVEGRYVDRSRLRKAGWAVFAAGAITGMAMMFASVNYQNDPFNAGSQIRNPGVFYTGVGIFLGSIITGAVLASQDDEAYINVYPIE